MSDTKKTTYTYYGDVVVTVTRPVKPKKADLKEFYDLCNILFRGKEECFYKFGECKKLGKVALEDEEETNA